MKLVALRCPTCAHPLAPENDDIVVACSNCQTVVEVGSNGPSAIDVRFALPAGVQTEPGGLWMPFWVFRGRVQLQRRETQGGDRSSQKEAEALWGSERRLFVPAWSLDLKVAQAIGSRLISGQPEYRQPEYQFVERPAEVQLTPATVSPDDARKLLEFIVLAIEARRKDWLRNLAFELQVGEPELWAMPEGMYG